MKNLIPSLLLILIFSNQSLAEEAKSKTQNNTTQQVEEDPDLKLSIEELRRKYPIGWLKERYGDSNHPSCGNSYVSDDYQDSIPQNLLCSFVSTRKFDGKVLLKEPKRLLLVKFEDFSDAEIKSVFIREPDNYLNSPPLEEDIRMWQLMGIVIEHLNKPDGFLTNQERALRNFVYSDKVLGPTKSSHLCDAINKNFSTSSILVCSKTNHKK
jgi:hypothetical protein